MPTAPAGPRGPVGKPKEEAAQSTPNAPEQSFIVSKGSAIPSVSEWSLDQGVDIPFNAGVKMLAVGPGVITTIGISGFGEEAPVLHVTGGPLNGKTFYYGHCQPTSVRKGDQVRAGEAITQIGAGQVPSPQFSSGPHLEFGQSDTAGTPIGTQTAGETKSILEHLQSGSLIEEVHGGAPNGPPEVGSSTSAEIAAVSKGAAISAFINLPGLTDWAESLALKGERSLMNDQPLLPFIEQLCQASLRQFMSMPNGNFYAFIPDYFGGLTGRQAYWKIHDIEILTGEIELSDDALATHVYIVGDTGTIDGSIDIFEKIQTAGVVTVFNAFMADFLTGVDSPAVTKKNGQQKISKATQEEYEKKRGKVPNLAEKDKAIAFLKKYGARPFYEEAPMIRSHYFEMFLAYQMFCLLWSKQFSTNFEFTFMPELFPGGLVMFEEHGIQCYIEEVRHEGNYEQGFTTHATLGAPSATEGGRKGVEAGMIRAGIFSPEGPNKHA